MICSCLVFVLAALSAQASEFPVNDANNAIAIAKEVCGDPSNSPVKWEAKLDEKTNIWWARDAESVCQHLTTHLWDVPIPVNGPKPSCPREELYTLACIEPSKSN
jgi:hypothetical protein